MGMKDIENFLKIVNKAEVEYLDKNTNLSVVSELSNDKYMVRYSGQISDRLRKHYKKDPLTIMEKNKNLNYSKESLKKIGLNKTKNVPSAVHIAAAIASYARLAINEYKNIPGNPCIMSDTDSVVLTKPLPDNLIGDELGQLKLVHIITEGIFIKKKLYYLKTLDNQEIIKSSGIDSSRLN